MHVCLANERLLLGFSTVMGTVSEYNHTMIDLERGDYSERRVCSSGDWYDTNPASMRDCKASHKGG